MFRTKDISHSIIWLAPMLLVQALRQAKGEALKLQAEEQGRLKELMDQMKELEKQLSAVSKHCCNAHNFMFSLLCRYTVH